MANTKTGDPAVDTFLKGYSPQVREIAVKAREAILSVKPDATEKVYPGWKVIQYGAGADLQWVHPAKPPDRERVKPAMSDGRGVPNPQRSRRGQGQSKRQVKFTSTAAEGAADEREVIHGAL